jgi:hypothetical protein
MNKRESFRVSGSYYEYREVSYSSDSYINDAILKTIFIAQKKRP